VGTARLVEENVALIIELDACMKSVTPEAGTSLEYYSRFDPTKK
jgi:hypothetical protein